MSYVEHVDLAAFDFALEIVGKEDGFQGKLAYNPQIFAESIGQRFTSSFEVSNLLPPQPSCLAVNTSARACRGYGSVRGWPAPLLFHVTNLLTDIVCEMLRRG